MPFVEVAKTEEIPDGGMQSYLAGIWQVLVANVGGKFFAVNNACSHEGQSLSQGTIKSGIVTCPLHGAKFDVTSGKCIAGAKGGLFGRTKIPDNSVFEVKVEDGKILINTG
jgi:3-phenylpropionate/trans-cinnamate dioxygenase ferredoxin component